LTCEKLDQKAEGLGLFDQIICTECIEHIQEDQKLVTDLAKVLAPRWQLLLTTPHEAHRPLRHEKLSETEDGGHVRWGYSEEGAGDLRSAWLRVTDVAYTSGWISQQLTNLMRVKQGEQLAWMITFPLRCLQWVDRPLNGLFRYPWFGIGIVAEKPASSDPL